MEEKQSLNQNLKKKGSSCFDWQLERYEKEMFLSGGYVLSHKPVPDLLQNCDLPPPLKLFSPIVIDHDENFVKLGSFRANNPMVSPDSSPPEQEEQQQPSSKELEFTEDTSLLRALHLSQTRAREAEKHFTQTTLQNQQITVLFLEESLRLSAHKNWVRLLETENSLLRKKEEAKTEDDDVSVVADVATWYLTLALCLGIAGVGLALGKCLF